MIQNTTTNYDANNAIFDAKNAVIKAAELNNVTTDEMLDYIKTLIHILNSKK